MSNTEITTIRIDATSQPVDVRIGEKVVMEDGNRYIVTDVHHIFRITEDGMKILRTEVFMTRWKPARKED